jgi:P-loop containing NTP hydrolase pore-1
MAALIEQMIKCGLGASELFSGALKAAGIYMGRQLSYNGAEFDMCNIVIEPMFQMQYSRAACMWQMLDLLFKKEEVFARLRKAGGNQAKINIGSLFWGGHQRFFKNMLMAAKVPGKPQHHFVESRGVLVMTCTDVHSTNSTFAADCKEPQVSSLFKALHLCSFGA